MLLGDPSWHTSSTGPTSIPSSSDAGRDDGAELSGPQAGLHPQTAVHRQAPVVGLHAVFPEPLGQLMCHTLGHAAGIHEHQGRAALLDVGRDPLQHRRHLLEGRHGTELVVGQLDGDVEVTLMADVHDAAKWLATR